VEPNELEEHENFNNPHWRLNKLFTDVYLGQGAKNPSITTRMATYEERQAGIEEKVNKIQSNINAGLVLLIGTLLSAVGTLVLLIFKH
jgi:hypothetical protein